MSKNFNWKFIPANDTQIAAEKCPVNMPPPINTTYVTYNVSDKVVINEFRANPIKHWRKQYSSTTPIEFGRATNIKNLLNQTIDTPNGTTVTQKINEITNNCNSSEGCKATKLTPNYLVGYRTGNTPDEYNNKVGVDYPSSFADNISYNNPCNDLTGTYKQCISVCDPEIKARKSVQYPSTINTDKTKPKYFQSNSSYLRARCKTFKQRQFNYVKEISDTCPDPSEKPGPGTATCISYYPNCNENCGCTCNDVSHSSCKNIRVYYKPNNPGFAHQGAVSSSTRLLRLKLNTVNTFANGYINNDQFNRGATANAYAYSSKTEAPFTLKNKLFNCSQNISIFHRNGNKTLKCPSN